MPESEAGKWQARVDRGPSLFTANGTLNSRVTSQLMTNGFVVVPGPVADADLGALADAYDRAVVTSDASDVKRGSTSLRVNDFINRDPCFDPIYVYGPLLAAATEVIGDSFKLSAFHARTVLPHGASQRRHQDFSGLSDGWPMVGFIFMVDAFDVHNGATRFVNGSQSLKQLPNDLEVGDARVSPACGSAGSMILFNGSVWHGHGPNLTGAARRSIQGALIRHDQDPAVDHAAKTRPEVVRRLSPTARALLCR